MIVNNSLESRLGAYRRVSGKPWPKTVTGKIMLAAFAATCLPLVAIVVFSLLSTDLSSEQKLVMLLVTLAATLIGSVLVLYALWVLLAPVEAASRALQDYSERGARPSFPTDIEDEGGRLLSTLQSTIISLDDTVGNLNLIATHDHLTGLFNRGAGEKKLRDALQSARETGEGFTLLILDVDGLKHLNDQWGHAAGDRCLQRVSTLIAQHLNDLGWVARWGGDEFVAVVHAGQEESLRLLGDIQRSIESAPAAEGMPSIGLAGVSGGLVWTTGERSLETLLELADANLYKNKRTRNRSTPNANQPNA